jgi:hypothetical protein
MSGSRIDALYTADDGTTQYCINADESNLEMIMGAQVAPNASKERPPKGFTPRYVVLKDISGLYQRKVPVLTPARYAALNGSTPLSIMTEGNSTVISVRVSTKVGERKRHQPKDYDSGLNDGD